jgi:large subunit ribosomal protein L14e
MITIGTVCIKTAGRDAGQAAVIVDILDNNIVMIDGQVRRRKCNIAHIEPTSKRVEIKKGASHADVVHALKAHGIAIVERKPKAKAPKQKTTAKAPVKAAAPAKTAPKAEAKPAVKAPAKK